MNRLNYFNPYNSKSHAHEDQLTRAYLVVLRHSYAAFTAFFDYCKSKLVVDTTKEEISFTLNELIEDGWELDTQKANPKIETNWLLSVLITDSDLHASGLISSVKRHARYDGVITFGESLTIIIENKPCSGNVWFQQLNPSKENLDTDTKIYSAPVVLEWKEILKQLNSLLNLPNISGYEKLMIGDFLSYIDEVHPKLNPYDNFSLCKGNETLIYRRIENLLRGIVLDANSISEHIGWGYNIEINCGSIRKIGLIYERMGDDWRLKLSLIFGNTISQARAFYGCSPTVSHLSRTEWQFVPDFHFSFMQKNLVWFQSPDDNKYLEYWTNNQGLIHQYKKDDLPTLIYSLHDKGIIIRNTRSQKDMHSKIFNKRYFTLNVCPGFGINYIIKGKDAEVWDKDNKLANILKDKIKEGMLVVHQDASVLLRK